MAQYDLRGNDYFVVESVKSSIINNLPVGTYSLGATKFGEFYLTPVEKFKLPSKVYGKTTSYTERILNTYSLRPNSTGVLLSGEKGSGKTLQAKMISIEAEKKGISTILIGIPFSSESFLQLIQSIKDDVILMFDEFEKVYQDEDAQQSLLTMMDGVYSSKKLFLLTCNDLYKIGNYLKNRPGRLFYHIEYKGLDAEFIKEYCEDNLNNKDWIENVQSIANICWQFNFDMLQALVEESNRYKQLPSSLLDILNTKPSSSTDERYIAKLFFEIDGEHKTILDEQEINFNPALIDGNKTINFYFDIPNPKDGEESYVDLYVPISFENCTYKNIAKGKYIYSHKQYVCVIEKKVENEYSFRHYLV